MVKVVQKELLKSRIDLSYFRIDGNENCFVELVKNGFKFILERHFLFHFEEDFFVNAFLNVHKQ